jgi:hypothetical protein
MGENLVSDVSQAGTLGYRAGLEPGMLLLVLIAKIFEKLGLAFHEDCIAL